MSGPRSDGSSATIGMQNLRRDEAVQTGFDQSIVGSEAAVTYRFTNGTYVEELADSAPPGTPLVTDSGMRTSSRSKLSASWITEGSKSSAVEFDYAIGTTPGGTDVRGFTTVRANSVVADGLLLENDATYYFAVRGRNTIGLVSEVGVSDGILVDTSFVSSTSIFPSVPQNGETFGGVALMAETGTDVQLRAVDVDGSLPMGLGIRNPRAIRLEPGEQWARLVSEVFGLTSFGGWIELEASESSLRAYMATGANDLSEFDGASATTPADDFFLFHSDADAMIVNPGTESVTATITNLETNTSQPLEIPARSRRTTPLTGPVRITAPRPIAAVERFGSEGNLGIGGAVSQPQSSLVFPHAVVGAGFRSWITLANARTVPLRVSVAFGSRTASFQLGNRASVRFSVAELFGISETETAAETDAVRLTASAMFGSGRGLVGAIDIESDQSVVTFAPVTAATAVVFPHVADENGVFTRVALAAGASGAEVTD